MDEYTLHLLEELLPAQLRQDYSTNYQWTNWEESSEESIEDWYNIFLY